MGTQSIKERTLESQRDFYEDKMIKEGEAYLLHKYYALGERPNVHKMMHLNSLFNSYSSKDCNVTNFLKKKFELKHNYLNVDNERRCEEFDICYTH